MKGRSVAVKIAQKFPQVSPLITDEVPVNSVTRSGTILTIDCDEPHGLRAGDRVNIVGAVTPISISSLTRSSTVGTMVTAADHDLTTAVAPTVTVSGATEAEFNGTFDVLQVQNRRTVTFVMDDSGPTVATGSPVLEGDSDLRSYDALYEVLQVPTSVRFTLEQSDTTIPDPIGTIVARSKARVAFATTPERAREAYTKQDDGKVWLFVVLEDVVASKSRAVQSDAVDNLYPGNEFRQQIVQPVTIYAMIPARSSIAGQSARDLAVDLFRPLCQSILGARLDSELYVGSSQGLLQFVSHGFYQYDTAVYVHAYTFHQVVDLVFEDTVGPDLDVAFREIDMTQRINVGGGTELDGLVATIDLDDVPL